MKDTGLIGARSEARTGGRAARTLGALALGLLLTTASGVAWSDTPSGTATPPLLPPAPAAGQPAAAPPSIATGVDAADRMTVPVTIDGQGPFPFIVDTGADHTVVSTELAAQLKLPPGPAVDLNDTSGVERVETAEVDSLQVGPRTATHLTAAVLPRANLGAAGMLGIDALKDQRVVLDFQARKMSVEPSTRQRFGDDVIVVRGKRRFGQLVLVDADARGEPILVVLDSGAQNSVANAALRARLAHRDPLAAGFLSTVVISVTGHTTPAEYQDISEVRIGGVTVRNLPLAFANLHTFDEFDLAREPAMLLGMDVLRQFERVSVDFGRGEVRFRLKREAPTPGKLLFEAG